MAIESNAMPTIEMKDEKMNSLKRVRVAGTASRSLRRRVGTSTLALLSGVASVAGFTLLGSGAAGASTLDGTATLTTPSDGAISYPSPSATTFEVTLPNGAACSSNTSANGTKVYTYLVPSGTSVAGLKISSEAVSTGYAFVDADGPVDNYNVQSNDLVPTLPNDFSWSYFNGYGLVSTLLNGGTSGVWEAGVLCADGSGNVTDYWNTEVTFTASGSDTNGFVWSAVPGDPNTGANPGSGTPEVPYAIVLPLLAIGIAGGTLALRRRRSAVPTA
jgi:hypothetical protein